MQLTITGPTTLQGSVQPSLVSTTYGVTVPAVKVRVRGSAALPARITTRISWADKANMAADRTGSSKEARIHEALTEGAFQT